jgi:hypothetical protein
MGSLDRSTPLASSKQPQGRAGALSSKTGRPGPLGNPPTTVVRPGAG